MADTIFIDRVTPINADWLNDVNRLTYDLPSSTSGKGASLIGVEDSSNYFSGENAEAIFEELGKPSGKFAYQLNALRYVPPAMWASILNYTSVDDHSAYIQAAIDFFGNASSVARGCVYLPAGRWNLNTASVVLSFEVSICGAGGRATQIWVGGDWDAFKWSPTIPSFSRQISITDLWIKGPGYGKQGPTTITMTQAWTASSGGTNIANIATTYPGVVPYTSASGININHPWGIDNLTLKRLWIEEFPNIGIRTNQPISGTTANCFQFSDWDSIYVRYCNIGILFGYGFTGESSLSNIAIQFMLTSCCDFTINTALTGPQGLNLINLAVGWSPYGIRMLAGTAGIIKYDMLHVESCSTAGVYLNSPNISKVVFESPWIAKCPVGILGDAGGPVSISNPTFQGTGNAADSYIKLNATSNFLIIIHGNPISQAPTSGTSPTNQISATDISSVRGAMFRTSATTGTLNAQFSTMLANQTRGIMSETATVRPNNLSGTAAISSGATSVAITFTRTEADTSYHIRANASAGTGSGSGWTPGISIGNKTINGFTAYFSSAAPSAGWALDWLLSR